MSKTPDTLCVHEYKQALHNAGIPVDPAKRSPDEQDQATVIAWAVKIPFAAVSTMDLDSALGEN